MKQVLFGIFAHPDDEAFGPSGTLLKMAREGVDIHLICLTRGEAGANIDNHNDLGAVRSEEWHEASKLIGAKSMQQFNFGDGQLRNAIYHEAAEAIEKHIDKTLSDYPEPVSIEFLTFDTNGLTGHIDHIAASMITTFVAIRLSRQGLEHHFTQIRYFCLPASSFDNDVSFVYWPAGRSAAQIDETIDVSSIFDKKLAIIHAHYSQRSDASIWLEKFSELIKQESFYFLKIPTDQES